MTESSKPERFTKPCLRIFKVGNAFRQLFNHTSGLESLILTLLNDVEIDLENMTFPDFLIFVSRRKSGNGVLALFDEYDKGK